MLASHARMHATEGGLWQDVLRLPCQARGLPILTVPEKRRLAEGALAFDRPPERLEALLMGLGKPLGPPWQRDHRLATLAALLALDHSARA